MKKLLLITSMIIAGQFCKAQMDDKFYQPSKQLKPFEVSKYEELKMPVESDTITAYILKPATKKPLATVFYFHGTAGNVTTYQYMTKPLVENNFQVVMVDFRGYGKSTGKPTHKNIASDGQKIFDLLMTKPEIKDTKILIYGASMGTQIATHLAKDNQDRISGLVLDGALASFTDIAMFYAPQYKDFIKSAVVSPYSAKEDIKEIKNTPKLFIHSKEDKEIPFEQGKEVYENAQQPKFFIEYSGDHLQAIKNNPKQIVDAIKKLITN